MTEDIAPSPGRGSNPELELAYQAERARKIGAVSPTPTRILERYRRNRLRQFFPVEGVFHRLGNVEGKRVLDFGCGDGADTAILAGLGARVTGVDLSPELIEVARRRIELDGATDRVELRAGDVLEMDDLVDTFDVLLCDAVLHHVPLDRVFPVLLRLVRPGGLVIVKEPIAFSAGLQNVRGRVPVDDRSSPEERQLSRDEIDYISEQLRDVRSTYYRMTARLARVIPTFGRNFLAKTVIIGLGALDRVALTLVPPLRRFAGVVVVSGRRPED